MLFSEPKIPQYRAYFTYLKRNRWFQCSSASRKFLNSSSCTASGRTGRSVSVLFSEPKIPQSQACGIGGLSRSGFSALQRAENSSMKWVRKPARLSHPFQCSSASRKFLNRARHAAAGLRAFVSVLFSEPKIPQSKRV